MGKSLNSSPHIQCTLFPEIFWPQQGCGGLYLVANHVPVNTDMIGAHDHESQFVFDLLFTIPRISTHRFIQLTRTGRALVNFALLISSVSVRAAL